jgi:hypothetical protein
MSAITRIRAWSNPGFTEGGPEAPHYGFTLPSPSEDLRNLDYEPSASRIFSTVASTSSRSTINPTRAIP